MNDENRVPITSAIVESNESTALVETDMTPETTTPAKEAEIQAETNALIEAIKKRAQAEVHAAEAAGRETYLMAVKNARLALEQNRLIDPERIEAAVRHLQEDAEQNWSGVWAEIQSLGDRLSDAAKAAWEVLTEPRDRNHTR